MDEQIERWFGNWNQRLGDGLAGRVAYWLLVILSIVALLSAAVLLLALTGAVAAAAILAGRFSLSMLANAFSPTSVSQFFAASPLALSLVAALLIVILLAWLVIVTTAVWQNAFNAIKKTLDAGHAAAGAATLTGVIAVCVAFLYSAAYYMLIGRGISEAPVVIPFAGILLLTVILGVRLPGAFSSAFARWLTALICALLAIALLALPFLLIDPSPTSLSAWAAEYGRVLGIDQLDVQDKMIFAFLTVVLILIGLLVLAVSSTRKG